jgi:small subunit ribosomal protein S15
MRVTAEKKTELVKEFGNSENNTGSTEAQIAIFTSRINHLTQHMKHNKKDFGTQRALLKMVGKRRRLLDYLKKIDIERYRAILKPLELRK